MSITYWIFKTSRRLSCHPPMHCLQHFGHSEWAEESRAARGRLCTHGWMLKRVRVFECARVWARATGRVGVRVHVWMNTAGHQQLWQASAVQRDECCHSQVMPNHSQNELLSSYFLSRSSPTSSACASQSHTAVRPAAGLDWAWKYTSVPWPLVSFSRPTSTLCPI